MASARWAWDWLRSRPQILIGGNKRWNRLELSEALALPEAVTAGETEELASGEKSGARDASVSAAGRQANNRGSKKVLTTRPRIQPSEELVWQTLAHHGVDYKRVPALEWACLQGIATARAEGILQSDLRRLVNQDKRSLPKRTDLLARKGYIAKRTVVVQKMKTSRLWLIDFAPPLVEEETCGLDLSPESLTKDLEPVPWHKRWTGNNIDMDALGRTVVGVVKAWTVIRYSDLRTKMGVSGKRWQMKTLAKNCQRLVDMGVFKYTAASFPGSSRKVFKDCLKFVREPSAEEWDKFLATGKKTSQYSDPTRHREPKPNALALYGRSGDGEQKSGDSRSKLKRIFSGWAPEKPIAQSVYEVIRRAGPEGASNPQVSVATVGYQHRRYLSSYLSKVAETQQPPHLKKFQIVSKLVRTGKTSAYMFSVPAAESPPNQAGHSTSAGEGVSQEQPASIDGSSTFTGTDPYGFGAVKPKAFADAKDLSLSALSQIAKKSRSSSRRKLQAGSRLQRAADAEIASGITHQANSELTGQGDQHPATAPGQAPKRDFDEAFGNHGRAEFDLVKPNPSAETPSSSATFTSVNQANQPPSSGAADLEREDLVMAVRYNGGPGKLRLCRSDNCLSFVKGGRGGNRKPVTIPLNVNFEEVATRDAPEGNEKSLVFIIGPKDDTSPSTYVFTFDDNDAEIRDTAAAIMREVKMINAPPSTEPDQRDEQHAPQDDSVAESAPRNLGPARGRGRGRGGSRGRGRKGQRLAGGAKPWICPTCGGSWKNDLGLKYHLEKAQVPCNPNFDPASLLERSRKRRKPSPPPPTPSAHSEVGDEGTLDRSRLARNARKPQKDGARPALKIRAAMRSLPGRAQQFRGLDFAEVDVDEEPESRVLEQSRPMPRTVSLLPAGPGANAEPESVTPTLAGNIVFPAERSVTEGTKTSLDSNAPAPTLLRAIQTSESIVHDDRSQRDTLAEDRIPRAPLPGHMESQPLTPLPTPRAAATRPTKPTKPQKADGALRAGFSSGTIPSHSAPVNEFDVRRTNGTLLPHGSRDASPTTGGSPVSGRIERSKCEYPEPPSERNVKGTWASLDSHDENTVARPFVPSSDYDLMATDAKRRTAQAFDIINYLLDNNGGVFPGDKALFYALTKVFLQEFRNQMPPTWKNCQTAVKALETRKLATMHTHMLKTERGRLQTCTLLIRSGVDPAGRIPTLMKHKMRETYPRIYIPTAFSPTQEELALLQELDKKPSSSGKDRKQNANGQKFRSKRQIDDIAVFNAPYYTQSAPVAGSKKDPLWIRESEQLRKDGSDSRKRSAADDPSSPSFQKRARTGFQEASTWPRNWGHTNQYDDDIPVDPKIMGPVPNPPSPSHGRSWLGDAYPRWEASEGFEDDISSPKRPNSDARRKYRVSSVFPERDFATWDKEPPSVVEAIRAYSLLPSIRSRRARRLSAALKPMSKLPPELGRIRNPGLSSLPASFFATGKAGLVRPAPAEVQFLGPSTNFDDGAKDAVEDQERMQFTDSTINEDVTPDQVGVEQSHAAPGESHAASQKFRFVLPAVLNGSSSDSWSSLEPVFVEHYATSVTLDGRLPPDKYLLAQDLRSSIEEMAQKLEAEETGANLWVDKEYAKFCSLINRIAVWEQSQNVPGLLNGDLAMADHLYVNVCPPNSKTMSATPRWSEETQFDVETLPYEDLEDDTYHDYLFAGNRLGRAPRDSGQAHKKRRVHKAEVNQVRRVQGRPPKFKLQATKTMREHTAYPKTTDDFLRAPGEENEELDWSSENVRLAAFVVVTTLLGGVDRVVDWGLMLRLMPDQT
jgi:transcription factor C subunit 3